MSARFPALLLAWLALSACAEDPRRVLVDLEGPRGTVTAPGPWGVAVLTDGTTPRLWVAVDEGAFSETALEAIGGGQFVGALPAAPVGTVLGYYSTAGDEALPPAGAEGPRRVTVVAAALPIADAGPPGECTLRFRRPREGDRLSEATDDGAPQAGLQVTVQVETDLPPGHAVRLRLDDVGHAGRVGQGFGPGLEEELGAGIVAFEAVTLPPGERTLIADAIPPGGGEACTAAITVTVAPP